MFILELFRNLSLSLSLSLSPNTSRLEFKKLNEDRSGPKEFIESLFPEEDIYLTLLDAKARLVLGRVGEATKPAQHLLEGIGFEYLDEVDPFDGGPHYGAKTKEVLPIKMGKKLLLNEFSDANYKTQGLVGFGSTDFRCIMTGFEVRDGVVSIPSKSRELLKIDLDQEVFVAPFNYGRRNS